MLNLLAEWTGHDPATVAVIGLSVLFAAFVRGMTGFGLAIVLSPLLGFVLAPERAVLLNILLGTLIGPMGFFEARKLTDASQTVPFSLAAIATAPLGLWLLAHTPADTARIAIAITALLSFFLIVAKRPPQPPEGLPPAIGFGAATGVIGAYAGIPGPPVVYYFVRDGVPVEVSRASLIVVFFWGIAATALFALVAGKIDVKLAVLALLMLPMLMIGNKLGERLFGKIDARIWRGAILTLLALAAVAAFARAF